MPFLKHIPLLMAVLSLIAIANPAMAQEENMLFNGSFEDLPTCCAAPKGWTNCGPPDETAPDIQPGSFEVELQPNDGNTYLGMVVRDNDTRESVGQELSVPILKDSLYQFKIVLAKSVELISLSKLTGDLADYTTPVVLKVYGGNSRRLSCEVHELLLTTPYINHTTWEEYEFIIQPEQMHEFILLEVDWSPELRDSYMMPYNGNLLLDNCSLTKIN